MLPTGTFSSPTPVTSVPELRELPKAWPEDHFNVYYVYMGWFLGPGMVATGTFWSTTSATSALEVWDHPHEVGLGLRTISMYYVYMGWFLGPWDGRDGDIFVRHVGDVGAGGPGPSP